jgi:tungstate transport system substrate-binding protein
MGVDGEADVLLAHAKSSEEEFVAEGHGIERFDVMYNDFVIVGPKDDSNNISELANGDVAIGFKTISDNGYTFVSRGDDSGTHKKELSVWKAVGITPEGDWYVSAGKGMGDVLQMTNEMQGYTLTDRATYLAMQDTLDLGIVIEGDENLLNQYGVIAVNPEKNEMINHEGANAFITWLLSDETQALIGEFGKDKYGQALFTPNAK